MNASPLTARLDASKLDPLVKLTRLAEELRADPKRASLEEERALGRRAIALGHPMLAFDLLSEGLTRWEGDPKLRYLSALALCRAGSSGSAEARLTPLLAELSESDPLFVDALSLAGRIAKDRCFTPGSSEPSGARPLSPRQRSFGQRAFERYERSYTLSGAAFPGINAASMATLLGELELGRRLAREIKTRCLDTEPSEEGWTAATLGEASLLLGENEDCLHWYGAAVERMGGADGQRASMLTQVRRLSAACPLPNGLLERLDLGSVIAFVGHTIDAPDRPLERFPARLESAARAAIDARLEELSARFGYSSAACGGDIIFAEAMLARGADLTVVLPFRRDDFERTSVAFAGAPWAERFDRVLATAQSVLYATEEGYLGHDSLFRYTNDLIMGAALLRGDRTGGAVSLLALVDPSSPPLRGGTAESLETWAPRATSIIDLTTLRAPATTSDAPAPKPSPADATEPRPGPQAGGLEREIKTMLFADIKGFSKLSEDQTPAFFVEVLGRVASLLEEGLERPVFQNTWGDGLFLVFDEVADGARFALRLRDAIGGGDWVRHGLPADLTIRTALHCGPVFAGHDPILARSNFFGAHVNRAARIEPVTAPGQVYCSQAVAALLRRSGDQALRVDYMGIQPLAKGYARAPLYRLSGPEDDPLRATPA